MRRQASRLGCSLKMKDNAGRIVDLPGFGPFTGNSFDKP